MAPKRAGRPAALRADDLEVAWITMTVDPKINDAAPKWTSSRLRTEPVTRTIAQSAVTLPRAAGLHGHAATWTGAGRLRE